MAGRGGYQRPSNPAPVSGPGRLSRRTDGRANMMDLPDAEYGAGKAFREIQSGAPMGAGTPQSQPSMGAPDMSGVVPLGAETAQPDVPVTDGAAMGPGADMGALGLPDNLDRVDAEDLRRYLPVLIDIANRDSTPRGTKMFVRRLIASM